MATYRNLSYAAFILSTLVIISDIQLPFIFRFDIYAWFLFGIFASIHSLDSWKPSTMHRSIILSTGAATACIVAFSYFISRSSFNYIESTLTIFGPFYFWILADLIHGARVGILLKKYSRYSFTIFLSHAYVISCCWQIWSINVGSSPYDNFIIFGIVCTTTVFLIAPVFYQIFYWWLRHAGFFCNGQVD